MELLTNSLFIALMVIGFGFVVFFHELGHFLAAKWVGIKVEQFAIGFGHAVASWRKGVGFRWGSSTKEYERLLKTPGFDASTVGETEYRINWMPLGGYVKMLGQDDLNPNATSDDPRSFNRKSVGARMLVVAAGVVMNVLLAAIGFMVVFLMGFRVSPAVIGPMESYNPAAKAGLHVGDRVLTVNGGVQHDYTKLLMNVALADPDETLEFKVERAGQTYTIPVKPELDSRGFLGLGEGRMQMLDLRGLDPKKARLAEEEKVDEKTLSTQLIPGDVVTAIKRADEAEWTTVKPADYAVFDAMLQKGRAVEMKVANPKRAPRTVTTQPVLAPAFGKTDLNFAGMQPPVQIMNITDESQAKGKLEPGDIILSLWTSKALALPHPPTVSELHAATTDAGKNDVPIDVKVLRDGKELPPITGIATVKVARDRRGLGIAPGYADSLPLVADVVPNSPAAGLVPPGSTVLKVDGQDVHTWRDIHRLLRESKGEDRLVIRTPDGQEKTVDLKLSEQQIKELSYIRYTSMLLFDEHIEPRQTNNPFVAAAWGVTETRDLLRQLYLTLHRVTQGSVSYKNLMGPLGIVVSGSQFAIKGGDWLVWFLAMISANLAVVNFLPIPVVDGGFFLFLIIEKIQGRPLSGRTQTVAQIIGLAMIISVFLLVTYQDIGRIFLAS